MDNRPIILHVIPTLGSGGAERLLLTNLSNPAIKDRYRHTVVLTDVDDLDSVNEATFLVQALRDQGFELIGLGRPGWKNLAGCVWALRRLIREKGADLLHTHLGWANTAGQIAGRLTGKRVITSFHSMAYSEEARTSFGVSRSKYAAIRQIDGFFTRTCMTQGIAVGHNVARHIEEALHVDPSRLRVIHNPVDLKHIVPRQDEPKKFVRSFLGLPESARIVIEVARVIPSKGHLDLVDAFRSVAAARAETHLVILGNLSDKNYVGEVRKRIKSHGLESLVHMVPPRQDVADFLAAADVFGFPSKYEGLPLALTEAMAAGVPCVVSDIGPNLELVRHDVNGLIIPVGDVQALARAIVQILDDQHLAKRLGGQAKIYVYENFHPDRKAEEMARLYEDVLSRMRK